MREAQLTTNLLDQRCPVGSLLTISPWVIQRHEQHWSDPNSFRPERFLADQASTEERRMAREAFLPFGLGPRKCPGAAFALQEALLVLAELVRRYEILPDPGHSPELVARLTLRSVNGVRVEAAALVIEPPAGSWPWPPAGCGGGLTKQPVQTLVDLLRYRARHQPECVAYVFLSDGEREAEEITYLQLDQQARRIGAWLQVCEPGSEAVGLLYQPGLSFIEAFFGCLYAGLVAIPLQTPPGLKRLEGLSAILRDAGTSLVLTRSDILETLQKGATTCEWARPLRWLATDHLTGDQDPSWHHPDRSVDSAAFYQYTSGTTGAPRGLWCPTPMFLPTKS
ncbi:cytochrome P450 [Cyanobium sp. ATX-6F1]